MHKAAAKPAKNRDVRRARTGRGRSGPNSRSTTQKAPPGKAQPTLPEGATRESNALFRLLFERNPDGVFALDSTGRFTVANPTCELLFGYTVAELLEKTFMDLCAPDHLAQTKARFRRVMAGHADACIETAFIRKDGRRVEVSISSEAMMTNGKFRSLYCTVKDITEHRRPDRDSARESEARERLRATELEAIFNTAPIGLAIAEDTQGRHIRGNRTNEEMFGLPPGAELSKAGTHPARYRVFREGRELPVTELPMQRAIRGEDVTGLELDVVCQDGRTVAVYANAAPLRDEVGHIRGAVGTFLDITARKRAEQALHESEARFRALVQASSDVVYRMSPDWTQMRQLVGRDFIPDTPKPCRKWLQKYIPPEDQERVMTVVTKAIRTKSVFQLEHRVLRVDGTLGWTFSRAVPILNAKGEITEWFGMAGDITERKEAEGVRARLAAIVECSADAISAMDFNGVITDWAPGAERLYGYSAAEAIGKPLSLIVPADRQNEIRMFLDKVKRGEVISPLETVRVRKDGHRVAVSVSVSPVRDTTGRIVGSSGISRDISERKRLEKQLLEVGEREQQRLGHDLHDGLCQELHGLCFLAKLLQRELAEELPGRAAEAERLAKVLEHSLQLTRDVARGLQPVNAIPEGLMLTLRELARRTRDLYAVDCRFECREPVLIPLHSAATHLYRIAQEAVNNAIKHARPKSIRIRLAATPQRILLGVRDNGVGIRRRRTHFRGMGLHIMQYRAEAIRGSLVVQRHPEGGTEVVCTVASQALLQQEESQDERNTAC